MQELPKRLTEKEAAQYQLAVESNDLHRLKLRERFLQRQRLGPGGKEIDMMLATTQKSIKVSEAYIKFLEELCST